MALCEIAEESISHISQFTQIGFTKEFADQNAKTDEFQYLKHLLCDFVKKRVGAAKKRTDAPLSD